MYREIRIKSVEERKNIKNDRKRRERLKGWLARESIWRRDSVKERG